MSTRKWSVPFQTIECRRCRAVRQRGRACPDCSAKFDDREVDQLVARRRRIVERARSYAESVATRGRASRSLSDIHDRSSKVLDRLFDALDAVLSDVDEEQAAKQLAEPLAELDELQSHLQATPRLRPFTAVRDATEGALAQLADAAESWVSALSAADMGDAQRLAAGAQRELDSAVPPLASASGALQDLEDALAGSSAQMLGFLAERTAARAASRDAEADADRGPYTRFLESIAPSRDEFSHLLAFEDERARLLFDRERFWMLVEEAYRQFSNSGHFDRLVADPEWRERFVAASDQLADAGLEAEAIAQAAFHERQLVRADLGVLKTLLEGPAKTLLRTRLALHRRRPFAQVRGDGTSILQQAAQAGLSTATLGLRKIFGTPSAMRISPWRTACWCSIAASIPSVAWSATNWPIRSWLRWSPRSQCTPPSRLLYGVWMRTWLPRRAAVLSLPNRLATCASSLPAIASGM